MTTYPTVNIVPGDDWAVQVTIKDSAGSVINYSGWTVNIAKIEWDGGSIDPLADDISNIASGIVLLSATDTETANVPIGQLSGLTLQLVETSSGDKTTPLYAEINGVFSMSSDAEVTVIVPGVGAGGSGDFVGPGSAVDDNFVAFDGTTGKLGKDSGSSAATFATAAQGALADSAIQSLGIGSSTQAWSTVLDTWATVTPSANGQSLVSAATYAAMRTLLDLEVGTDFYSIPAADAAFATAAQGALADSATQAATLASTSNGDGASLVGVEDVAGNFTGTDVEAVLAELVTLGGGDEWGDVVDADILPDADSTRDIGATANRFAEGYFDSLFANDLALSGQSLTGAAADSALNMATTWNTTGTPSAIKLDVTDTASNASSLLMDLLVDAAKVFSIDKSGTVNVYNTYTDASNYERLAIWHNGSSFRIEDQNAGTGSGSDVFITSHNGSNYLQVGNGQITINKKMVSNNADNIDLGKSSNFWKSLFVNKVYYKEQSADPSDPAEGQSIIWQSNGTGSGDDGDIMMKITAGATTKTVTLVDFSAA